MYAPRIPTALQDCGPNLDGLFTSPPHTIRGLKGLCTIISWGQKLSAVGGWHRCLQPPEVFDLLSGWYSYVATSQKKIIFDIESECCWLPSNINKKNIFLENLLLSSPFFQFRNASSNGFSPHVRTSTRQLHPRSWGMLFRLPTTKNSSEEKTPCSQSLVE